MTLLLVLRADEEALPLREHHGLAVFCCEASPGMCDTWEPDGGANHVAFLSDAVEETLMPGSQSLAMKRIPIALMPADSEVEARPGDVEATGSRNSKVGGTPRFLQETESVGCPTCELPMKWTVQLASPFFEFGDAGTGHVAICPDEHAAVFSWAGF